MESILSYCRQHNKVFCYGAGEYGRMLHSFLCEHEIDLAGFIVTRKNDCDILQGVPIYEIGEIVSSSDDFGIIIGAGSPYAEEMKEILHKYGREDYLYLTKDDFMRLDKETTYNVQFSNSPMICVLCYHRICNLPLDTWNLAVPPNVFDQHIEFLKQNYNILRFEEDWSGGDTPSVVITIDDGYFDAVKYALPIFEKHNVPATVFVATGNLDKNEEFWYDKLEQIFFCNENLPNRFSYENKEFSLITAEDKKVACYSIHECLKSMDKDKRAKNLLRLTDVLHTKIISREMNRTLTSEELKRLATSPYITIGGHTVTHPALSMESEETQETEIFSSKNMIEDIIGRSIDVFSYPFGGKTDFTSYTRSLLKKAGYRKIASAYGGLASKTSSLDDIPRNGVPGDCTVEELAKKLRRIWCVYGD